MLQNLGGQNTFLRLVVLGPKLRLKKLEVRDATREPKWRRSPNSRKQTPDGVNEKKDNTIVQTKKREKKFWPQSKLEIHFHYDFPTFIFFTELKLKAPEGAGTISARMDSAHDLIQFNKWNDN